MFFLLVAVVVDLQLLVEVAAVERGDFAKEQYIWHQEVILLLLVLVVLRPMLKLAELHT
jgi:hypothetical protein